MMFVQPEIRIVKRINARREILLTNRSPIITIAHTALRALAPYPERRFPPAQKPPRVRRHPPISANVAQVVVTDVRGQIPAAAQAQLTARGFPSTIGTPPINSSFAAGTVSTETPAQGTIQPIGTLITLILSLGPVQFNFPDLTGMAYTDALVVIGALPGVLRSIIYQDAQYPFPEVVRGTVLSQYPLSGATYNAGVQVDLVLASGYVFFPGIVESVASDPTSVIGSTTFP